MSAINHILVATDLSERAARAEGRAAQLCGHLACRSAELLAVGEPAHLDELARILEQSPEKAKAVLGEAFRRELEAKAAQLSARCGIDFAAHVAFGPPAVEIAARSERVAADLIVVGSHGGNFFAEMFLGNTADKLIRRCTRPLLIVRNDAVAAYRNILVPVDFSEDSRQAAELALRIDPEADVTFLHVYEVLFAGRMSHAGVSRETIEHYRARARRSAVEALDAFIDSLPVAGRHVVREVAEGHPSAVVRDRAQRLRVDLIVIGKHGRSRLEELIVGSVTRDTIDWTSCDIIVVPPVAA